jgi:hypothetical protein
MVVRLRPSARRAPEPVDGQDSFTTELDILGRARLPRESAGPGSRGQWLAATGGVSFGYAAACTTVADCRLGNRRRNHRDHLSRRSGSTARLDLRVLRREGTLASCREVDYGPFGRCCIATGRASLARRSGWTPFASRRLHGVLSEPPLPRFPGRQEQTDNNSPASERRLAKPVVGDAGVVPSCRAFR